MSKTRLWPFSPNRGQWQPRRGQDRPRTHRDHYYIALDGFAVDLDARHPALVLSPQDPGDPAEPQLGAPRLRCPHHRGGKPGGMNLGRGFGGAEALIDPDARRQPINVVAVAVVARVTANARIPAMGGQAAVAPVAADLLRQPSVQRKTPPGERFERGPVAPVEGEEAARFAGSRAGHARPFDDRRCDPAADQEISDRGADHAAAANQNTHRTGCCCNDA